MPEINLLPDDLRGKEKRELESVKKKPKVFKVEMSSPGRDKINQPLKNAKPSLISRIFSRKSKKAVDFPEEQSFKQSSSDFDNSARKEKRVFDIPDVINSSNGDFSKIQNNSQVAAPSSPSAPDDIFAEQPTESISSSSDSLPIEERKNKFKLFNKKEKSVRGKKEKISSSSRRKSRGQGDRSVLELNLIPEELSKYPELEFPKRLFRSGLSIFLTILVVIGAYLGITWYQLNINNQITNLEAVIADVNEEIAQQEAIKNNSEDLQQRITVIEELLNKHVYWTAFFEQLENYTLPQVYYLDFAMTGTERLVLSAITDSYSSVAKQIVAFEQADDFVKNVQVSAASAQFDNETGNLVGVDFSIELEFQPEIFLKNSNN